MVWREIKRSIGEALAALQFDEFGLPVNIASATLYLFCLSHKANILPLSKNRENKSRLSGAEEEMLTHIQIEKSGKVKDILGRRGDSTNLIWFSL